MRPCLSYLICGAERTGSTLLCDALAATGIAGRPRSYFNPIARTNPSMQRILELATDDEEYLHKVVIAATTPNGIFGARVHWHHFLNLFAKLDPTGDALDRTIPLAAYDLLRSHLPELRHVWIIRRNGVARAISHYRAKKTNRWYVDSRRVTDDIEGEGEPAFDFDEIEAYVRSGEAEDEDWRRFFREHNIAPLEVIYEEFVLDYEATVRRVLAFLGIPSETIDIPPPISRQLADHRSKEWEARYRQMDAEESA